MKFRDFAADQTSAAIGRLLDRRSKRSSKDLQALRRAFDEATNAFEATLSTWAKVEPDDETSGLVERLAATAASQVQDAVQRAKAEALAEAQRASAEAQAAIQRANAEAQAAVQRANAEAQAAVQRTNAEAQAAIEAVRKELAEQVNQNNALTASVTETRAQAQALRTEVKTEHDRADAARADHAQAHDAHAKAVAACRESDEARQQESQSKAALEGDLKVLRAALEASRVETRTATEAVASALEKTSLPLDRLLALSLSLASSTAYGDVLAAVAGGLASDFPRVALFTINGNRLEGGYHIGFDSKIDVSEVVIPLTTASPLTRAVSSGRVEALAAGELPDNSRALFGGTPQCVLALPITVHGETLAVVYADDSGQPRTESVTLKQKAAFAELLRRHAVPVLEKLTIEPRLLEELRAYATLLLDEVEYVYSADVKSGKAGADLKTRLKDNLQCARQMYAQRIASEGAGAAAVFDERLVRVSEERAATPFGRDLAALSGPSPAPPQAAAARPAVQASARPRYQRETA